MIDIEILKNKIVERLKPLEPEKVILFGSYAWGSPDDNSDLDIYVVTKDDYLPQNFKEKTDVKLKVSKAIRGLQKEVPIDIITHTQKMHKRFIEQNSMFSREIMGRGIRLLL